MMSARHKDARGMTLLEVLMYTAISAVVLNLCAVTFVQTTRLSSLATERAMRQQALAQFSRDVVRTVHGASRVVANVGETDTNEGQVVLETPDGYAVIGMAGKSPAIWHVAPEADAWRINRITKYPVVVRGFHVVLDAANVERARRVTVHLIGPERKDPEDTINNRVIVAALRMDGGTP